MRTFLILILLIISSQIANSQMFLSEGGKIDDFKNEIIPDTFNLKVSLPVQAIDSGYGLSKVCINISHERISDLKIELIAPDATRTWLTNRNGGEESDLYFNTCFSTYGFSGYIHQGKYPYTGEYIPDGRLELVNNGQNPNGIWKIIVTDLRSNMTGSLNFFSLSFENNPNPGFGNPPCSENNPAACACPDGKAPCNLLPDLVILESFTNAQIEEFPWNHPDFPGQIRFAATIANIGTGPMEIFGLNKWFCGDKEVDFESKCENGEDPRQNLVQRVYRLDSSSQIIKEDIHAGTNYFDRKPGHNHYHVDDWVEFRLLKEKQSKRKLVSEGRKISYCLFDTGICNNPFDSLCFTNGKNYSKGNLINYGFGEFTDCKFDHQGISVGGYDTYGYMYEGQYLKLPKRLKPGFYILEIEIDPEKKYLEADRTNNTFRKKVFISKQKK